MASNLWTSTLDTHVSDTMSIKTEPKLIYLNSGLL